MPNAQGRALASVVKPELVTRMTTPNHQLGYQRAIQAIRTNENPLILIVGLSNGTNCQDGVDLCCGAISCVLDAYEAVRVANYLPRSDDREIDIFLKASDVVRRIEITQLALRKDTDKLSRRLAAVCAVVRELRDKITWRDSNDTVKPEPLDVRVVAMPDRFSEMGVQRDEKGNIINTTRVESDIRWN
jgi:hypothetical protein